MVTISGILEKDHIPKLSFKLQVKLKLLNQHQNQHSKS